MIWDLSGRVDDAFWAEPCGEPTRALSDPDGPRVQPCPASSTELFRRSVRYQLLPGVRGHLAGYLHTTLRSASDPPTGRRFLSSQVVTVTGRGAGRMGHEFCDLESQDNGMFDGECSFRRVEW